MENFLYSPEFSSILQIIAIDIVLGGDNAIVIALACKNLPEKQRKLGIFYGALGAIILRVLMVFFATYLLAIYGLKIIGGVLLIWIGVKLCLDSHEMNLNIKPENRLLAAVKTIIIADFVMSFDNSLAIAAAADGNIYIVIFGLLLSVPIIIWGSKIILKLIDKYPQIIYLGGFLLGWIGGEMIQSDVATVEFYGDLNWTPLFGALIVWATSFLYKLSKKNKNI